MALTQSCSEIVVNSLSELRSDRGPLIRRLMMMIVVGITGSTLTGSPKACDEEVVISSMTTTLIRQANISTRDSGVIQTFLVKAGDRVDEGQVLGSLDDELQALSVKQAEPNLRVAEIKATNTIPVETAKAQVREAEEMLRQLNATAQVSQKQAESEIAVQVAEKSRELAEFELNRAQKAKESFTGSVSKVELNRLQTQLDQRTLEVQKAGEDRAIAKLKSDADHAALAQQTEIIARHRLALQEREKDILLAAAGVEVARAELELARLQLQRRRLIAPFSGFVEEVFMQPGEWVERGVNVIRIIQLDVLRAEGFASAEVSRRLHVDQKVRIQFHDTDLPEVEGRITFVGREIEPVNQRVHVWAEFQNPDLKVRPGLVATMRIGAPDQR
ncbi:MAG: HlyD family secretion protein [Planctomycetota bacterium]